MARRRALVVVALAVVLALVVALVVIVRTLSTPDTPVACQASVGGVTVSLTPEQMGNAGTIAGIAVRRGLPARAATIAIATAMQESKLVNVAYGDRDSLGLFQQRPSQGWGTTAQVRDPVHATNAFYDALVKVRDYRSRPITEVAQRVQRSGFPEAYAQHEAESRVLASALTGNSPAALTCVLDPGGAGSVTRLRTALADEQPSAASTPLTAGLRLGAAQPWALAQWAVARSAQLGVARVYVDGRVWSRAQRDRGWTAAAGSGVPARGGREVVVLFTDTTPA